MNEKLSYEEALGQLEKLVLEIEDPSKTITALSDDLKRAMELIKYCKACLRSTEEELRGMLDG